MAYLKKEQYERRRKNADERNANSAAIAVEHGMTEEEADLIWDLCRVRHEMHTHIDSLVYSQSNTLIHKELISIRVKINETNLPELSYEQYDKCDEGCIGIDDIDGLYEYDDVPESGTPEWQNWYDDNYARIYNDWEELNTIIEKYLQEIDKKYCTAFAPTGALRVF